jgi:hypothetical protein
VLLVGLALARRALHSSVPCRNVDGGYFRQAVSDARGRATRLPVLVMCPICLHLRCRCAYSGHLPLGAPTSSRTGGTQEGSGCTSGGGLIKKSERGGGTKKSKRRETPLDTTTSLVLNALDQRTAPMFFLLSNQLTTPWRTSPRTFFCASEGLLPFGTRSFGVNRAYRLPQVPVPLTPTAHTQKPTPLSAAAQCPGGLQPVGRPGGAEKRGLKQTQTQNLLF